jgi:integrase
MVTGFFINEENIATYIDYLKDEERAPATIEKYIRDIRAFMCFLDGAEITKQLALEWRSSLFENHAPTTINTKVAALNGFFEFFDLGIRVKPLKIQQQTFLPEDKELTEQEYRRLLEAAKDQGNDRIFHVIQTICSTGIRVSELKFITLEAVQIGHVEVQNKGKIRTIFIPHDLKILLLRYAKKHGIVSGCIFVTRSGRPLDRSNIWAQMKKLCAAAGVDESKVHPHSLRKLFARMFYAKDKDLSKLADSLGSQRRENHSYLYYGYGQRTPPDYRQPWACYSDRITPFSTICRFRC